MSIFGSSTPAQDRKDVFGNPLFPSPAQQPTTGLFGSSPSSQHYDDSVESKKGYDDGPNFRTPHDLVQVLVGKGEDKATFNVYREFLIYHSPYFKGALTEGNFKESGGVTELDHATHDIFGLFVEWLYTQQVRDLRCKDVSIEDGSKRQVKDTPTMDQLVSLWILADYLQCPNLQNQAIDLIILKDSRRMAFNSSCIMPAYENTLPGSPLRKVFVDICFWHGPEKSWFRSHSEDFPKELLVDLVVLNAGDRFGGLNPLLKKSNYHF